MLVSRTEITIIVIAYLFYLCVNADHGGLGKL